MRQELTEMHDVQLQSQHALVDQAHGSLQPQSQTGILRYQLRYRQRQPNIRYSSVTSTLKGGRV